MVTQEAAYLMREQRIADTMAQRIQRIDELTVLIQRIKAAVFLASNGTLDTEIALEGILQEIKDAGIV